MKLRALGCYGGNIPGHGMTSFLVNDALALDAGWVSNALTLKEQEKVKDILISHSHLDHTCTLPFLIDNNFTAPGFSLRIYAIPEVVASMRNHLFNNHTWPDFTSLPNDLTPVLKLVEIEPEQPFDDQRPHDPCGSRLPQRAHRRIHPRGQEGGSRVLERHGPDRALLEGRQRLEAPQGRHHGMLLPHGAAGAGRRCRGISHRRRSRNELKKLERDVPVYLYGGKPKHLAAIKTPGARAEGQASALPRPGAHLQVLSRPS